MEPKPAAPATAVVEPVAKRLYVPATRFEKLNVLPEKEELANEPPVKLTGESANEMPGELNVLR